MDWLFIVWVGLFAYELVSAHPQHGTLGPAKTLVSDRTAAAQMVAALEFDWMGGRVLQLRRHAMEAAGSEFDQIVEPTCRSCVHFDDDPAHLEAEVPGILVFGSAYSSARGHAGMCRRLDRFLDPILARQCPSFKALDDSDEPTSSA